MPNENERDLVLAPNEYALIQDQTKGTVDVYVGPTKTSLSAQDKPIFYDYEKDRFVQSTLDNAIKQWPNADEGSYIVLSNPVEDDKISFSQGRLSTLPLSYGRRINIPGPARFPLFPGQHAEIIKGHRLRSNQYLLVRVINPEEAEKNWNKAIVQSSSSESETVPKPETLSIGQQIIIKGTEVSFYIPPTGIEVVKTSDGQYVRDALTLELLEYCILKNENGNKRYEKGPKVVFPNPDEMFIESSGNRKFTAIELNHLMGIYIKVTADYSENGNDYKVGDELFITGNDQKIYYPREEHSIIEYDKTKIHYAVAIPSGEGRYVLNRESGEVFIKHGPCMFLPDPRKEVIVRRVLDLETCELLYPGNQEAKEFNTSQNQVSTETVLRNFAKDSAETKMVRKTHFTPPRTITLDTKYDGVVSVNVFNGYAVLVVNKNGGRKVVTGPQTILLEYDETLETISLSTGKPKTTDHLLKTVYLRVLNNKISDLITVETKDSVNVTLKLSYRVNFEGNDPEKWFAVENYVKFVTDHIRSLLKNSVRKHGIEEFYQNSIDIVRETILGTHDGDNKRPGKFFVENNMRIYDVEVLEIEISQKSIKDLLIDAQHVAVKQTIEISQARKELSLEQEKQSISREIDEAKATTESMKAMLKLKSIQDELKIDLEKLKTDAEKRQEEAKLTLANQKIREQIEESNRNLSRLQREQEISFKQKEIELEITRIVADTKSVIDKAEAIQPDLIAALQAFSDQKLVANLAESVAPLAIISKTGISDIVMKLFNGTPLQNFIQEKTEHFGNGTRKTLEIKK